MTDGPLTVLSDVFWANQRRMRLLEQALAGTGMPAEDYPLYVLIGVEGPWSPTGLAERMDMPLSTITFRIRRLEQRGHAYRTPNPDDGRSFVVRLTPEGEHVLAQARPAFRAHAEAVEARLGADRIGGLQSALAQFRDAIDAELEARRSG